MDDMNDADFYDPEGSDAGPAAEDPKPETGLVRQGFGTTELLRQTETMSTAMAAAAQASIQARYIMAMKAPRDLMAARAAIMEQAERPTFAEAAIYRLPREKWDPVARKRVKTTIEGPTIRFAEAVRLAWRNLVTEIVVVHEDDQTRLILVTTTDLETNITETGPVTVKKVKEVTKVYPDTRVISKRTNSEGQTTYTVPSNPSDVDQAQNSAVARVKRNQILALIPANVKQDAIAACKLTIGNQTKQQLGKMAAGAQKAFADLNVPDAELTAYLGHPVTEATPEELNELRGIATGIREGTATWRAIYRDAMEARQDEKKAAEPKKAAPPDREATVTTTELTEEHEAAAVEAANEARRKGTAAARAALGERK
jgi:hypothetical protein